MLQDRVYRDLLDLFMASDPWPLSVEANNRVGNFLSVEAQDRDMNDWVEAFHALPRNEDPAMGALSSDDTEWGEMPSEGDEVLLVDIKSEEDKSNEDSAPGSENTGEPSDSDGADNGGGYSGAGADNGGNVSQQGRGRRARAN